MCGVEPLFFARSDGREAAIWLQAEGNAEPGPISRSLCINWLAN